MTGFDFANASFVNADNGKLRLDRDWIAQPPTQFEVEALFASWLQFDGATAAANVMRFLVAVSDAMTPPRALPGEGKPDATG